MGLPCEGSFHDPASGKHLKVTEETHPCDLYRKPRRDLTEFRPELFPGTAAIGQNLRHLRMRFMNLAQKRHRPVATPDVGGMDTTPTASWLHRPWQHDARGPQVVLPP